MNCQNIRDQLLQLEHPDRPGADLRKHVKACDACRRWLRRLTRLELALPRLPVEVPPPPAALFAALESSPRELVRPPLRLRRDDRQEGGRRKLALASALAASLALFALGFWAWSAIRPLPSPLAAFNARIARRLAGEATPAKRSEALARLAENLLDEASPDNVAQAERLARQFEHLMATALPEQARGLHGASLAPVLAHLARTESRASRLAASHQGRIAAAYARMARAAQAAEHRLRA